MYEAMDRLIAQEKIMRVNMSGLSEIVTGPWYIHQEEYPLINRLENNQGWSPGTTLLSPFDNLICDRRRTRALWEFDFSIEIYVPKKKRKVGHYVLPILHEDQLIGRIDPKMDRKTGVQHINNMYHEKDASMTHRTGKQIASAIEDLGMFLGAKKIETPRTVPEGWRKALKAL